MLGDLALIWLRISEPNRDRPFKIPLGTVGLTLFMLPHFLISAVLAFAIDREARIIVFVMMLLGAIVYVICRRLAVQKENETDAFPVKDLEKVFENIPQVLEERYGTVVTEGDLPDLGLAASVVFETMPVTVPLDEPSARPESPESPGLINEKESPIVEIIDSVTLTDDDPEYKDKEKNKIKIQFSPAPEELTQKTFNATLGNETTEYSEPNTAPMDMERNTSTASSASSLLSPPPSTALAQDFKPNGAADSVGEGFQDTVSPSPPRGDAGIRGQSKRSTSRRRRVRSDSLHKKHEDMIPDENENDTENKDKTNDLDSIRESPDTTTLIIRKNNHTDNQNRKRRGRRRDR